MNTNLVTNQLGINLVVVKGGFINAGAAALGVSLQGTRGVGVVGGELQTVGHQLFDIARLGLTVCYRENGVRVLGLDVLHELLDILALGSKAPDLGDIVGGVHHLLVAVARNRVAPGVALAVTAELGVEVGGLHIKADDVVGLARMHRGANGGNLLDQLVGGHIEVERRHNIGNAVVQEGVGGLDGVLGKEHLAVGVGVNVDKTGADIGACEVDDLVDTLKRELAAKIGNFTVLNDNRCVTNEVVGHNDCCVNQCLFHSIPFQLILQDFLYCVGVIPVCLRKTVEK